MPPHSRIRKSLPTSAIAGLLIAGAAWIYFSSRSPQAEPDEAQPHQPNGNLTALPRAHQLSETEVDAALTEAATQSLARHHAESALQAERTQALQALRRQKLEDQAGRLEKQSNSRVDFLGDRLGLSEAQRDQVFQILVRNSRGYDEKMAVTGEDGAEISALPDEIIETLDGAGLGLVTDGGTIVSVNSEWGFAIVAPHPAETTDPAETGTDDQLDPETRSIELAVEEIPPAELSKLVEEEAIAQVLEPEQSEAYASLLDEVDGYWSDLVTEVTKEIETETAASPATPTEPSRQK